MAIGRRGSQPSLKDLTSVRTPPKKLGDATMLPSKAFLNLTKREGIHVPKMKKDLVYDVHSDMMTMPS